MQASTSVMARLRTIALKEKKRIILPEQEDIRVLEAAKALIEQGLCTPVFLSPLAEDLPGAEIFWNQASANDWHTKAMKAYYESRKHKGCTLDQARIDLEDPLLLAALLVRLGYVDGGVAGSIATSGKVVRSCILGVGLAPGSKLISGAFLMELPNQVLTFADIAVNPNPSTEQLAQIAIDSAATHAALVQETPKVALLSFSTKGSAAHDMVNKVRDALPLIKEQEPNLAVDGELQFDSAYVPSVAAKKAPNSPVAGQANVFVFPDLNAGNIGAKIIERTGGANAIGPILQGAAKPWMDLSRGCKSADIVDTAVIAAVLVQ